MFFVNNTNVVALKGLRDVTTQSFVNDAVLTVTLYDANQAENLDKGTATAITGASGITMTYRSSSNGEYYGVIPQTVQLTAGTNVIANIVSSNYGINRLVEATVVRG